MSTSALPYKLSLGPLQFHWPKQVMLDFYRDIESTNVDIVYLGETVCSKRREFGFNDWVDVAERLLDNGKEVVLSTLALVEARSELGYIKRQCDNGQFMVEANDMSAVRMLGGDTAFVGGATLNIQNQNSLKILIDQGLLRWVAPHEMPASVMNSVAAHSKDEIECEVFGWGRMPMAYSARCYTTRALDIRREFDEYLKCGRLEHGFLRVQCEACQAGAARTLGRHAPMGAQCALPSAVFICQPAEDHGQGAGYRLPQHRDTPYS